MSTQKQIGKIQSIRFGQGGYQDAMIGLSVSLGSDKDAWGVGDFRGTWDLGIKVDESTKWTEKDRDMQFAETMRFVSELLTKAKVGDVSRLVGTPVEVTFENNKLKSWRVLEEAI